MKHIQTFEAVNEAVKVEVERYKRSHQKNPKGFGSWAFSYNRQGIGHFFTPQPMNYKEAVKWAKEEAKRDGEGYIYVMESINEGANTVKESVNEGKYDHLMGNDFEIKGKKYRINKIEGNKFAHVIDDRQNKSTFKLDFLVKKVPGFTLDKPKKARGPAWNKGQKTTSKREYEKILKGAMKDARGMADAEFTHDMATSMIYDPEIQSYLTKEYPRLNKQKQIQRLQWDLEMYESVNEGKLPKKGSIVKLNKDINLISYANLKGQKLTVIGTKKTGLISEPIFLVVKDEKGKKHEINPDYISESVNESKNLKKGDILRLKTGQKLFIVGPKGDGYSFTRGDDRRQKDHAPKGWFDMMISTGKMALVESVNESTQKFIKTYEVYTQAPAKMIAFDGEDDVRQIMSEAVNENIGQTFKEFGDLWALLNDKVNTDAIEQSIKEMDRKKAITLEKQISKLYNSLFKLA